MPDGTPPSTFARLPAFPDSPTLPCEAVTQQRFEMDTSAAPVIVTTYHELSSAQDFAALEAAFEQVYARGGKMVFIADLGHVKLPSAEGRRRAAEMEAKLFPLTKRHSLGAVNVVRTPVVRGAMTAIRWFARAATDELYVATMAEAVAKAKELLAREGVALPEEAERRLAERVARADR